jgi:hypothetical protein
MLDERARVSLMTERWPELLFLSHWQITFLITGRWLRRVARVGRWLSQFVEFHPPRRVFRDQCFDQRD